MEMRPRPQAPPTSCSTQQLWPCSLPTVRHYSLPLQLPLSPCLPLDSSLLGPYCSLLCSPLSSLLCLLAFISGLPYIHHPSRGVCPPHVSFCLLWHPSPALHLCCPSPPPHCPVWPEDRSPGETSKGKQNAVTSLYWLICHFSSSHKGHNQQGLNSGLT